MREVTEQPRQWQEDAVAAFLDARKGIVVAPPGTGKTAVAISVMSPSVPTVIVVSTLDLSNQWRRELEARGVRAVQYDEEHKEIGPVTITTYATACQLDENDPLWNRLIILDEVHHLADAPVYQRILVPVFKAPFALGLTATPPTDSDSLLLQVLPIIYRYTLTEARQAGHIAPIELIPIPVDLTPEERKAYDEFTFRIAQGFKKLGTNDLGVLLASSDRAAIKAKYAITKRRDITIGAFAKYEALMKLLEELRGKPRILIFSERIEVLETCRALFGDTFTSEIVSGETPREVRADIFQRWGREFQILLTARVAEEGVNVVEVDTGIILAGTSTARQNLQRQGRLVRPLSGKTARLYLIYAKGTTDEKILTALREIVA
jgi:superfamily II DNA or RNA helicase